MDGVIFLLAGRAVRCVFTLRGNVNSVFVSGTTRVGFSVDIQGVPLGGEGWRGGAASQGQAASGTPCSAWE